MILFKFELVLIVVEIVAICYQWWFVFEFCGQSTVSLSCGTPAWKSDFHWLVRIPFDQSTTRYFDTSFYREIIQL